MIAFGAENKEITTYPFIESIKEVGGWNRLEVVIQFGKVVEKVINSRCVASLNPDANERYLITFDWYLFYIVGNESHYTGFEGNYKGRWLTMVEDSELLKLGAGALYGYDEVENRRHYHLLTSEHVFDVITSFPPTIEKLPPLPDENHEN